MEAQTQRFVLRGNAHGTRIQVTLARHDAANREQCGRAKTKFIRPQNGGDENVPGETQSAIHTQNDSRAQPGAQAVFHGFRGVRSPTASPCS